MHKMSGLLQKFLLALGIFALIFLLIEIGATLAATQHGSAPAQVDHITAGPYHFTVDLYDNPARAGFALPFAIAPQGAGGGSWTYQVMSVPVGQLLRNGSILMGSQREATPIKDSVGPEPGVPGGVQGAAEITVQGLWKLHVVVNGPAGQQTFDVPVTAATIPAVPPWMGWALGFIPVYGIVVFLLMQAGRKKAPGTKKAVNLVGEGI